MVNYFSIVTVESSLDRWAEGEVLGSNRNKAQGPTESNCRNVPNGPDCPPSPNIDLNCLCPPNDDYWVRGTIEQFLEKLKKFNDIFKKFYKLLGCNNNPQGEVDEDNTCTNPYGASASCSLLGAGAGAVEGIPYPENFLQDELTKEQKKTFVDFCKDYLNIDAVKSRKEDNLFLNPGLKKHTENSFSIEQIDHDSYTGIYYCSNENLIEMQIHIKRMNILKNWWGFEFKALPSKYDDDLPTFVDKLLYKIASKNVSEKYPCTMFCDPGSTIYRFPAKAPRAPRDMKNHILGPTMFSEFFSYNGWETNRVRREEGIQEDTDITNVAKLLGTSDTKRYFTFEHSNEDDNSGEELYLEITRFILYEKIISKVSIKNFISKFKNELGNSISLKSKINDILNANLAIKPMEKLEEILTILESNDDAGSDNWDKEICTKLKNVSHKRAVADAFNSYYGVKLGRTIEFSSAKEQAKLIHTELHNDKWGTIHKGNIGDILSSARQFYLNNNITDAVCYAMGCSVNNVKSPDGTYGPNNDVSCKPQERDISDEEEHIPPATKFQALATLKFNTNTSSSAALDFKMIKFLSNLFKYLKIYLTAEQITDINNIILEEQSLLLLPSSKIYNQMKSSRDLISFRFKDGKLNATPCDEVYKIIKACIDDVIKNKSAQNLKVFSDTEKEIKDSGGCGNVGQIIITQPTTVLNTNQLWENLNNWCDTFNIFSEKEFNKKITYGKLVHYISILFSFTLLTFMSHFYDQNFEEHQLGFSFFEPEIGDFTTIQLYNAAELKWLDIVKKRKDPTVILEKMKAAFCNIKSSNPAIYTMSRIALKGLREAFDVKPDGGSGLSGGECSITTKPGDENFCQEPALPCPSPKCAFDVFGDSYSNTFLDGLSFIQTCPKGNCSTNGGGTISKKSKKRKSRNKRTKKKKTKRTKRTKKKQTKITKRSKKRYKKRSKKRSKRK